MEYRRYKKWLEHTLPRLQEWANSDADDRGDCPLVQDEANWILGLIQDQEKALAIAVEVLDHIGKNCVCHEDDFALAKLARETIAEIERMGDK